MIEKDSNYFINNPIFVNYKTKFSFYKMTRIKRLKCSIVNERIAEIPFVFESLPDKKDIKILDLGCTESILPIYLASIGYKVLGVDFRIYPYIHPNFMFIQSDIAKLPLKDESCDVISCISTLEHIGFGRYSDPAHSSSADLDVMRNIFRVLKKEGILILTLPFGVCRTAGPWRIYDSKMVNKVLKDFKILEKIFFVNRISGRKNYWQQIDEAEASTVKVKDETANCVCLIRAYK